MLAVLEPGKKRRHLWLDAAADWIGNLVAVAIVVGVAVYPVVLAVQSGYWWLVLLAVAIIGGGVAAMLSASRV